MELRSLEMFQKLGLHGEKHNSGCSHCHTHPHVLSKPLKLSDGAADVAADVAADEDAADAPPVSIKVLSNFADGSTLMGGDALAPALFFALGMVAVKSPVSSSLGAGDGLDFFFFNSSRSNR